MACLTSCGLNHPAPSSNSPQLSKTPHVLLTNNEKAIKNRRVNLGVACMVIGLEMGNLVSSDHSFAIAEEFNTNVASKGQVVAKWSDKRTCSPWQTNSLETIVPENLPRPSARRRWELIGFQKDAPTVKYAKTNCFSM